MPLLDLTEDEHAELVRLVRQAIEDDRFFLAPRAKRLRSILSKLDPAVIERAAAFYSPPKPAGHREAATPATAIKKSAACHGRQSAHSASG
jgi:hypothetical protein